MNKRKRIKAVLYCICKHIYIFVQHKNAIKFALQYDINVHAHFIWIRMPILPFPLDFYKHLTSEMDIHICRAFTIYNIICLEVSLSIRSRETETFRAKIKKKLKQRNEKKKRNIFSFTIFAYQLESWAFVLIQRILRGENRNAIVKITFHYSSFRMAAHYSQFFFARWFLFSFRWNAFWIRNKKKKTTKTAQKRELKTTSNTS